MSPLWLSEGENIKNCDWEKRSQSLPFTNYSLLLVFLFCSRSGLCIRCCTAVNILGLKLTYSTAVLSKQLPVLYYLLYFPECEMDGEKG